MPEESLLVRGRSREVRWWGDAASLEAPHVFVEDVSIRSVRQMKTRFDTTNLRERLARHHVHVDAAFHGWSDVWLDPAFRGWTSRSIFPASRALSW